MPSEPQLALLRTVSQNEEGLAVAQIIFRMFRHK